MFQSDFDLDDEEDNALLAHHLDEVKRGVDFLLTPHLDRRVRRLGVHHRNYNPGQKSWDKFELLGTRLTRLQVHLSYLVPQPPSPHTMLKTTTCNFL